MEDFPEVRVLKALGDESRLRAVLALRNRELCVCQVVELLQLAPSTISKHLQVLKDAGLVKYRKKERWVYYRLVDENSSGFPLSALRLALNTVATSRQARLDAKRLKTLHSRAKPKRFSAILTIRPSWPKMLQQRTTPLAITAEHGMKSEIS